MKAGDLKGKTVINVGEAERLGQADDVAVNLDERKIAGILLGSTGLFGTGPSRFIPAEAIHSIGEDAITVRIAREGIEELPDQEERRARWPHVSQLHGARVVSERGNLLGEVREIEFDPNTLDLVGFYISPKDGGWRATDRLMPADAVVSWGEKLVMVRAGTAERVDMEEAHAEEVPPEEDEAVGVFNRPESER